MKAVKVTRSGVSKIATLTFVGLSIYFGISFVTMPQQYVTYESCSIIVKTFPDGAGLVVVTVLSAIAAAVAYLLPLADRSRDEQKRSDRQRLEDVMQAKIREYRRLQEILERVEVVQGTGSSVVREVISALRDDYDGDTRETNSMFSGLNRTPRGYTGGQQ